MKNIRGIRSTLANVDLFEQVVTHLIALAPPCYSRHSRLRWQRSGLRVGFFSVGIDARPAHKARWAKKKISQHVSAVVSTLHL